MNTGAAIGFIIWAIIGLLSIGSLKRGESLDYRKIILNFILMVGLGYSIGYLLS